MHSDGALVYDVDHPVGAMLTFFRPGVVVCTAVSTDRYLFLLHEISDDLKASKQHGKQAVCPRRQLEMLPALGPALPIADAST